MKHIQCRLTFFRGNTTNPTIKTEWLVQPGRTQFLTRCRTGQIRREELDNFVQQHQIYSHCYQSAAFDKTLPSVPIEIPDKLIHKAIKSAGVKPAYSDGPKHLVFFVDLPSHATSLFIGGLLPGGCSNWHRHTYETQLYVLEERGFTLVEHLRVDGQAGDAVYIRTWGWHHHVNLDYENPAKYLACENAPMIQNMGRLAMREEAE